MPTNSPKINENPVTKTVKQMSDNVATTQSSTEKHFEPEKVLFAWRAPSRPFKSRSREFWITVISIASLLAFILYLAEGVMPVMLISSLVFLYYILSTVHPEEVDYQITNRGVKFADKTTTWDLLTGFRFSKSLDNDILVLETVTFPGSLDLTIFPKDIEAIKTHLLKYLEEVVIEPTYVDKATDWIAKKLPEK